MVPRRKQDRSLFEVLLPDSDKLWPAWLKRIDTLLEDEAVIDTVAAALEQRWPKSCTRGREGTPAEIVLRMLILKHLHDWEPSRRPNACLVPSSVTPSATMRPCSPTWTPSSSSTASASALCLGLRHHSWYHELDGETVETYEQGLPDKLQDLCDRVRPGGQDCPGSGGRDSERHLRSRFVGFSYGFRPGRSPHQMLRALHTALAV